MLMLDKKYNFSESEKEVQKYWAEEKLYEYKKDGREIYSVDYPPPNVSGTLHIGHICSYTQAEIAVRYRRLRNYNIFFPFGYDDNGLPTERLAEKKLGIYAKDMPRSEFIERCSNIIIDVEKEFKKIYSSLGFNIDWNLEYQTISKSTQRISQRSFLELAKMKKAYQKEMPVLWCTHCDTSIAQAELETKLKETEFVYIKFKIEMKT